ncbi:MAG: M20/M25/M40 family metallo-hydrolase [Gammaproteobacteria bacterium]|nr:M20/M25/M40 family metallo-hydrolase [Gammaproteobacteria bacterium]MDH3535015.1 M20/M25/M40 family metallo-hydrolase [Gammaproteobacteria bacterium]
MTIYLVVVVGLILLFTYMVRMPGDSYKAELSPLDEAGRALARQLESHVRTLCSHPAGRNYIEKKGLALARDYIAGQLASSGYQVEFQVYRIAGEEYANIEVTRLGEVYPDEIIVVGAHYDAVVGAPGANDNGSGVAALLELADRFKNAELPRTIRFVAFVNEEPPHFMTGTMGSDVYARHAASRRENIVAMYSLETIGYFRDDVGSQRHPPPFGFFYPSQGNFIAFVGNLRSRGLVTRSIRAFRSHATFPSEGIAAPGFIPGVNWSDHWSFWKQGYPAIMITDTAPYRYPYYHAPQDTPDKVDYKRMVYVVRGLEKMLEALLNL